MMQFEKSTLQYLKDLQKNNNRDWFSETKPKYLEAQKNAKEVFAPFMSNYNCMMKLRNLK